MAIVKTVKVRCPITKGNGLGCMVINADDLTSDQEQYDPDELRNAISKLDPDNNDHWTTTGKPQTDALSDIIGRRIKSKERDEAWRKMNAQ